MKKLLLLPLLLLFGFGAGAQCVATFTSTATSYNNNNLLYWQFSNTSGPITGGGSNAVYSTGAINYGDGTSQTGLYSGGYFNHNYAAPGTYTVGMRVNWLDSANNNALVCTDSATQIITVAYTACATSFAVTGSSNTATRTFTATTPGATGPMTYTWNFGDGSASASGSPVTHTYTANGTYYPTLIATGGGCTYSNNMNNTIIVTITNLSNAPNCANLHALFSTFVNQNFVTVYNNSTYLANYPAVSTYSYGDGTANTNSAQHNYAAAGTYTIKLKVQWHDSTTGTLICSDSTTHNVTISTIPNNIYGNIFYDSLNNWGTNSWKVWLIQSVTSNGSTFLNAIDSQSISSSYPSYNFTGKPAGNYFVKAAALNQTTGAAGLIPTYHDSSVYWNYAQNVVHSGTGYTYANIWMKNGTVSTGPGFVGGNVSLGANKGAQNGVAGLQIYLRNIANVVIKSTVTNANGDFTFSNIPAGTYNVYPEQMNYATLPASFLTVTTGAPTITGINFNQDNTLMNIRPRNLSIGTISGNNVVYTIAPNPAGKVVTVSWTGVIAKGAHLVISNLTGQVVIDKTVGSTSAEVLDVSSLQTGVYFLRGTGELSGAAQKLMIK